MTDDHASPGAPPPEPSSEPASGQPATSPPPTTAERQSTPFLVLQFFIFPMAIVAVCVTVFVVFGLIASEGKGPRDYLNDVRTGSANRRWQAAFELSKVLQARRDRDLADPRFVSEIAALFDDTEKDDPRVRRYLALALGRLGDKRAVPGLLKAVRGAGPDADTETVIYSVWALGAIGDPATVPDLVRLAASEDRGVRKAAVHALGVFPGEEARAALVSALGDAAEDVRWNAALALGRRGDTSAAPVLLEMMDRAHLAGVEGVTSDQQDEALLQAVVAAARFSDPALRAAIEKLRDGDPSLKVREVARSALGTRP